MDSSNFLPLRGLPRVFIENIPLEVSEPIELPKEEFEKFRKVLRLERGDKIGLLPGNGTIIRCEYQGKFVLPLEVIKLDTEPKVKLTLIQALPRMDKLETIVRMGTEMGVFRFIIFPSDRSLVRWDKAKLEDKIRRLQSIARESVEVSFRAFLPKIIYLNSFQELLIKYPDCLFLSEQENVKKTLISSLKKDYIELVIGPEGGWAPREVQLIGNRAITLGARVLRVETAALTVCANVLFND